MERVEGRPRLTSGAARTQTLALGVGWGGGSQLSTFTRPGGYRPPTRCHPW